MPLKSNLFRGDRALESCLINDAAHIKEGAKGDHVAKIQTAVSVLNGYTIRPVEISARVYGHTTTAAVLAYKKRLSIINRSYQTQPDAIVGKMTIAALDAGMVEVENRPALPDDRNFLYFT
jgi:hypothetical protein